MHVGRILRAAALFSILGTFSPPTPAASYDPDLTWRTLTTPHFNITFHGGEEQLAEEAAQHCEEIWAEMTAELEWVPNRRTEVVLVDHTDSANGYATTLPVNTIVIYVTAPTADSTLSTYEDWSDAILTHEYTHILHLDTVEGLPKLLRAVFGRIISVNQISPGWVVEGQATFQETRYTNGGRGRSTIAHMVKRLAVLEDEFPPLGNMDGWQSEPPAGNLRYLFGQDFQQYIADRTGEHVWTDFIHSYAGGIPYLLPGKRSFGKRIPKLYREWRADMTARYTAQADRVRAESLTEFRLLSDGEDRCAAPVFSPDGAHIVWACADPSTGSAVWLANGDGSAPEIELDGRFARDFTWRADGTAFAYSSMHVVDRFNMYSDVYLHTLAGPSVTLTSGARARQPTFSPDGRELLVVTNGLQNNQLARLTIDQTLTPLTEFTDHTQLDNPAFSPDGRHVAVSVWQQGQRDLWLTTAAGEFVRRVTADVASDVDPAWSADGQWLYFSSDRTGIFNIYAVELSTERLYQVTNVLGGAFQPSPHPNGAALVFTSFSHNGPDIAWMDVDPAALRDRGYLPRAIGYDTPLAHVASPLPIAPAPPLLRPTLPPASAGAAPNADPDADTEEEAEPDAAPPPKARARAARRAQRRDRMAAAPPLSEALRTPGMDGLGGPWHNLSSQPGRWGLPGEQPDTGEFVSDRPDQGVDNDDPTRTDSEVPEEQDYAFSWPVDRYRSMPTLLPPRYFAPGVYRTSYGYMGTLATSGSDTLRRYLYSAWVSYRTDSQYVGWGASVGVNRFVPVFSAGAYTYTVPYGSIYVAPGPPAEGGAWVPSIERTDERYWDKRLKVWSQATFPSTQYRTWFARYSGTLRQPLNALPQGTYTPSLPTRGYLSALGGGWRYAKGKYHTRSISPEDARVVSLVGQLYSRALGSYVLDDTNTPVFFDQLQLTAEWREYTTLPWGNNHVLAAKLAGGASLGDTQRYGAYRLGGSYGESAYYTLPDEWRALRGYAPAAVYGDNFYLGSLEYRLPLWYVDRGWGTIPFFARTLSAAAYLDAGNAWSGTTEDSVLASTLLGAGAELRGSAIIGWGIPVSVRAGYAFSVRGDGIPLGSLSGAYAWLGTSF